MFIVYFFINVLNSFFSPFLSQNIVHTVSNISRLVLNFFVRIFKNYILRNIHLDVVLYFFALNTKLMSLFLFSFFFFCLGLQRIDSDALPILSSLTQAFVNITAIRPVYDTYC